MKTALATALLIGLTFLESGAMAAVLAPVPLIVTNGADDGTGSLRAAIRDAMPGSTITFNFAGVISLTSGELLINKHLTIAGPGPTVVTVSRNSDFGLKRLVEVSAGMNVNISGLTFSGGSVTDLGGGILNHGLLTLNDVRVINNSAIGSQFPIQIPSDGAGCVNSAGAEMSLTNCTVTGNVSNGAGGGILNLGTLTVTNSTISNNHAADGGGVLSSGTATITSCTISGNEVTTTGPHNLQGGYGGGLALSGSAVLLSDTISANSCAFEGGGLAGGQEASDTVSITNCILAANTSQTNPDNADLTGSVQSGGYNLIGVAPAGSSFGVKDLTGTSAQPLDPRLDPLQDNGGPTLTMAFALGSPAIDQGVSQGLATDQRGMPRTIDQPRLGNAVDGDGTDIGAFELAVTLPTLGNTSTRARVETGDNVLIAGFIIAGIPPKKVIVRAIGPSLPLTGALADPILELKDSTGTTLRMNDNWKDSPNKKAIIDSTIPPTNDKESAILMTLQPGAYTAIVRGVNSTMGVALVEVYVLDQNVDSKLVNISSRGFVQTDDNVMIAGMIVLGSDLTEVLIRAIGPSLPVSGKLADPTLELHNSNGAIITSNDDWRSDQEAGIIATTIPPPNDKESAILITLTPGPYTAIVRGKDNTTGIALVEAYQLGD